MFSEEFNNVALAGKAKLNLLKESKGQYLVSAMLAGIYVGLGIMLIFTIGGLLTSAGSPVTKIVMGASFGVALSLVAMAGAELFTGNNFIMTASSMKGEVSWGDTIKVWIAGFIGNLLGSILAGIVFWAAGLATGPVGEFIANTSATKMSLPAGHLFFRGILCNVLVCLAIWCTFRLKSDSGKLIMIFWCLFVFITAGFEHSIANMTLLTIGLLAPHTAAVSIGGYIYNIGIVTLGNMVGGILLALAYYYVSKKKK